MHPFAVLRSLRETSSPGLPHSLRLQLSPKDFMRPELNCPPPLKQRQLIHVAAIHLSRDLHQREPDRLALQAFFASSTSVSKASTAIRSSESLSLLNISGTSIPVIRETRYHSNHGFAGRTRNASR